MLKSPRLLGLVLLLTASLTFLKLDHVAPVAGWSWLAVTSPLWAPWLLLLALLLALLLVVLVVKATNRA